MNTASPLVRVVILLYVLGVIVTFGHAWAHFPDLLEERGLARAFMCGIAWPFYWSGWLWSH